MSPHTLDILTRIHIIHNFFHATKNDISRLCTKNAHKFCHVYLCVITIHQTARRVNTQLLYYITVRTLWGMLGKYPLLTHR